MVCTKKIETMPDVESWTSSTPITSNSFYLTNAAYGNGVFIAFSQTSDMLFSQDGINWSLATAPFTNAIITSFCNGMFVIVRATGALSTSTDGVNWTTPVSTNLSYSSASGDFIDIIFNGTQYVAISVNGYISTSTDLVTWSTYTQNSNLGSNGWEKVLQRGNEFIALSRSKVSKSSDGINWSAAQSYVGLTQGSAFALGYKNKIVAVNLGSTKTFYESTDGINWASYTLPSFTVAYTMEIVFGDNVYTILYADDNYKACSLHTNTKTVSVIGKYLLKRKVSGQEHTYKLTRRINTIDTRYI